jgi:hypothetical protein
VPDDGEVAMPKTRWAGLAWALAAVTPATVEALLAWPGTLPAASWLAGASNGLNILYVSCGGFALLLTPTGRLPSRRWRWWAWVAAVFVAASALDPVPFYPDHPEIGSPLGVQAMAEPPLDLVIPAAGVVVLVALGLGQFLDRDSSLAVGAATLGLAAVFRPARRVGWFAAGGLGLRNRRAAAVQGVRPRPRLRRRAGGGHRHPAGLGR